MYFNSTSQTRAIFSADLVLISYFPVADFAPGVAALPSVLTKPVEKWVFTVVVAELFHPGYKCLGCIELQGREIVLDNFKKC